MKYHLEKIGVASEIGSMTAILVQLVTNSGSHLYEDFQQIYTI